MRWLSAGSQQRSRAVNNCWVMSCKEAPTVQQVMQLEGSSGPHMSTYNFQNEAGSPTQQACPV